MQLYRFLERSEATASSAWGNAANDDDNSLANYGLTEASFSPELLRACAEHLTARCHLLAARLRTRSSAGPDGLYHLPQELVTLAIVWVECVMSTTTQLAAQDMCIGT